MPVSRGDQTAILTIESRALCPVPWSGSFLFLSLSGRACPLQLDPIVDFFLFFFLFQSMWCVPAGCSRRFFSSSPLHSTCHFTRTPPHTHKRSYKRPHHPHLTVLTSPSSTHRPPPSSPHRPPPSSTHRPPPPRSALRSAVHRSAPSAPSTVNPTSDHAVGPVVGSTAVKFPHDVASVAGRKAAALQTPTFPSFLWYVLPSALQFTPLAADMLHSTPHLHSHNALASSPSPR